MLRLRTAGTTKCSPIALGFRFGNGMEFAAAKLRLPGLTYSHRILPVSRPT